MKIKSEKDVEKVAKAGVAVRVYVGDGLYAKLGKRGTLSWLYQWHAKPGVLRGPWARGMGGGTRVLGHWPAVSLDEAREVAAALERVRRERGPEAIPDAVEEVLREWHSPQCAGSIVARGEAPEDVEAAPLGAAPLGAATEAATEAADGAPSRAALVAVDTLMSAALSMLGSARALLALGVPSEALGASYEAPPCGCGNKIEITPKVRK